MQKIIVGKSMADVERGELVTAAVCCFSTISIYVPPVLV